MWTLFVFFAIFSNTLFPTSATFQEEHDNGNDVVGCQDDPTDELSLLQSGLRVQAKGEYIEEHRKTDVNDLKEADTEMLQEWNEMKENGAFNVVTVEEMESLALKLKNIWDERTGKTLLDARRVDGPDDSVALEQSITGKASFDSNKGIPMDLSKMKLTRPTTTTTPAPPGTYAKCYEINRVSSLCKQRGYEKLQKEVCNSKSLWCPTADGQGYHRRRGGYWPSRDMQSSQARQFWGKSDAPVCAAGSKVKDKAGNLDSCDKPACDYGPCEKADMSNAPQWLKDLQK